MNTTKIIYYLSPQGDNPFSKFLDSLEYQQQTKILRLIMQVEQYGLSSISSHTKKMSGLPLWEIRILGKDNLRIIYFTRDKDSVIILHGFNKKTKKTPSKEIETSINRYNNWQSKHWLWYHIWYHKNMNKQKIYTFQDDLRKRLKDPEFKKTWDESEPEYLLTKQLIEKRLAKKLSQRDLAKKLNTSQAAISRIESMNGNPSFLFLKRIAFALDSRLCISITWIPN